MGTSYTSPFRKVLIIAYDQALFFVTKNLSGPELPIPSSIDLRPISSTVEAVLFGGGGLSFRFLRLLWNDARPGAIRKPGSVPVLVFAVDLTFTQQSHMILALIPSILKNYNTSPKGPCCQHLNF